jgi:hypothetical protein
MIFSEQQLIIPAKALFIGSIPIAASNKINNLQAFLFPLKSHCSKNCSSLFLLVLGFLFFKYNLLQKILVFAHLYKLHIFEIDRFCYHLQNQLLTLLRKLPNKRCAEKIFNFFFARN